MSRERSSTPQENKDTSRLILIISVLLMAVLLIADLYVMINRPGKLLVLVVITVLLLACVYVMINAILAQMRHNSDYAKEQFESIYRSGKANYLMQKKALDQMETIKENVKTPSEDIITAQKAIAKVTISRNKENADALMNSNDKVMERMFQLEERLEGSTSASIDKQKEVLDDSVKEMVAKQQQMIVSLQEMQQTIKEELAQAVETMNQLTQENPGATAGYPMKEAFTEKKVFAEEEPFAEESGIGEMPLMEEEPGIDEMPLMEEESGIGEMPLMEEEPDIGEMPLMEEEPGIDETLLMEEEPGIGEMPLMEEEPGIGEMPLMEENPIIEEADSQPGFEIELEMEEEPKETPAPDLSNPNKIMTPDEIAALIANL